MKLNAAKVFVIYLPKQNDDSQFSSEVDKFRILELTQYRRVLYLDRDLVPFCNLDYYFELSDGPNVVLSENVILSHEATSAYGAIFMLTPKTHGILKIMDIINQQPTSG